MTIGQRIKTVREQAGITQAALGEKIGVSGVAIMRYEKGTRQPRLEQLDAIADALNVSPFYLLGDETAKMSRTDLVESMGLEDYLKSLGYKFILDYEYEGEAHVLCIDQRRQKLYLLPPQRLEVLEQSIRTFTKFSVAELMNDGKEIKDTDGWFSHRQDAPRSAQESQKGTADTAPPQDDSKGPQEPSEED